MLDPADEVTLTLSAEYIHDSGMDNPVAMIRQQGAAPNRTADTYYYHKDALGSVTEITDSSAVVVKSYEYKTFGTISRTTGTLENPYTYTSREYDAETGLYYYRARYYNPMQGRFINKDPIGIQDGPNRFIYVGNNPVNMVDPTGEAVVTGALVWAAIEIGLTVYDAYELTTMYLDPTTTDEDFAWATGLFIAGILGPGGGGVGAFKITKKAAKAIFKTIKKVEIIAGLAARGARKIDKINDLLRVFKGTKAKYWSKRKGWDHLGREWHWYEYHEKGKDVIKAGLKIAGFPDPPL
ncbi:RHS repeat-associated core domain-containing protein [Thermodesulfobacteriota bacterium]